MCSQQGTILIHVYLYLNKALCCVCYFQLGWRSQKHCICSLQMLFFYLAYFNVSLSWWLQNKVFEETVVEALVTWNQLQYMTMVSCSTSIKVTVMHSSNKFIIPLIVDWQRQIEMWLCVRFPSSWNASIVWQQAIDVHVVCSLCIVHHKFMNDTGTFIAGCLG